jgi:GT2 family glycosyltransferase
MFRTDGTNPRIAVLMTCHNRRDLTLASVKSLAAAFGNAAQRVVILVDAGSSDGTAEAVRNIDPTVQILRRGADLYWNSGMREAWKHALQLLPAPDFYLWLNDDLALAPGTVERLLADYEAEAKIFGPRVIVAGRTIDPHTAKAAYGGFVRGSRFSRISFVRAPEDERYCVAMNGNCVLIPGRAVEDIGILSDRYSHSIGDVDYSLRAGRNGYRILQSSSPVGVQGLNLDTSYGGKKKKQKLSLKSLRFVFTHPKGMPFREWLYFCRSYAGPLWPVNFVMFYLRLFRF